MRWLRGYGVAVGTKNALHVLRHRDGVHGELRQVHGDSKMMSGR